MNMTSIQIQPTRMKWQVPINNSFLIHTHTHTPAHSTLKPYSYFSYFSYSTQPASSVAYVFTPQRIRCTDATNKHTYNLEDIHRRPYNKYTSCPPFFFFFCMHGISSMDVWILAPWSMVHGQMQERRNIFTFGNERQRTITNNNTQQHQLAEYRGIVQPSLGTMLKLLGTTSITACTKQQQRHDTPQLEG